MQNEPMRPLHLVQGGIDNRDKALLERLAHQERGTNSWVVPKCVEPGDDVVIYVRGYGFFATAKINSGVRRRRDWKNRYGAALRSIKLVNPPIILRK
jgi:hypothetical protein